MSSNLNNKLELYRKLFHIIAISLWIIPGIQGLWANMGLFLSFILFDKEVTVLAILILAIGDGLSGIVGYYAGKRKIYGNKTLEGTLTFLISSFVITLLFYEIKTALIVSIVSTLTELFLDFPDDNFTVPLSAGLAVTLLH